MGARTAALIVASLTVATAAAEPAVSVHHQLQAFTPSVGGSEAVVSLYIDNRGDQSLSNVRLRPASLALALDPEKDAIHIGSLGVGESTVVQWQMTSPVSAGYLQGNMPIQFNLEAVANGTHVVFPVYSIGEVAP